MKITLYDPPELMTTLAVVFILLVVALRSNDSSGKREDCDPEILEAFDYLLANLDKTVEIGQLHYTRCGWAVATLDGETFAVRPLDGGWVGLFTDRGEQVGFWKGHRHGGWHFYSDFYLGGSTIHLR